MKKIFMALMLLVSCMAAQALETVKLNGTDRTMIVYAPDNLPENAPLFISCHGMNQDAAFQSNAAKFENLANQKKFVIVYPNGINKGWDLGGNKDIDFMDAIINEMVKRYKINRSRVYISGFSMGGMFTYFCANRMANRVAAFCPVSGYPMGGPNASASRAVPILHTHGTGDDVCSYSPVQSHIDAWVKFNKCNTTPVTISPYPAGTQSPAVMKKYKNGTDGVEVWLLTLKDKGHWWSMDTYQAVTTDEVYNFCMKWSLDNPAVTNTTFETDETTFEDIDASQYEREEIFDAQLDTVRAAVAEGIPEGWKRVTGTGDPVAQNTPSVAGCRMKYFQEGGDFNSGFYLSARDNNICHLYYGCYAAHRLALEPGIYEVTFNSIYWSEGAFSGGATFNFNVLTTALAKVKGASFKPKGCVYEDSNRKITGSAVHTARFTITTAGNYVLDFCMDQGWNSVIVGNMKVNRLCEPGSSTIETVEPSTCSTVCYDLQGCRTTAANGLYIQGGKVKLSK